MAHPLWLTDGSGVLTAEGASVSCTAPSPGNKGNALLHSSSGSGLYTFRVSGSAGGWVGVAPRSKFGAAWAMKGLFLGGPGNLADGGGLVAGGWGPALRGGDTLVMRVEQAPGRASLAFSRNGAPLGLAFDIVGWAGGEPLHPAVSLDEAGQGVALVAAEAALPPLAAFLRAPGAEGGGVEGSWVGRFSLSVKGEPGGGWALSARVGNVLGVRVEAAGPGGAVRAVGGVRSSMMMPPPEVYALEQEVCRLLRGITGLRRVGGGLVLAAGGGAEEAFQPAPPSPAAGLDQVHWMQG